jgi:hypothetical protein
VSVSGDTLRPRPRIDARTTAWLLEQRGRNRRLELELARLRGQLDTSDRIERASNRYADRLEERLDQARRREASLARAVGYLECQRDELAGRIGGPGTRKGRKRVPRGSGPP